MKKEEIGTEEIYLMPETETAEAGKPVAVKPLAEMATASKNTEKFVFTVFYALADKEVILPELKRMGAVIVHHSDKDGAVTAKMSMAQLAAIKTLECVERVEVAKAVKQPKKTLTNTETQDMLNTQQTYATTDNASVSSANTNNNGVSLLCYDGGGSSGGNCSNDISTAIDLPLSTWMSGGIYCPGAEMWYRFTANVSNAAQYTVYTSGSLDTMGYLYDANGYLLDSNDDSGGALNFSITSELTYGATYYVCVTAYGGNTGSYDVRVDYETVSEEPDDDGYSNDMSSAINLSLNSWHSGEICCPSAEMWYKFTPSTTAYYTLYTVGSLDTVGHIYDADCNQLDGDDDAGAGLNFKMVARLTAGHTYYVQVAAYGNNTGCFSIAVTNTVFVEYVEIDQSYIELDKGETVTLTATVEPSYATNKTLHWETSDSSVATVNQSGVVTARGAGTACIRVYSQDGSDKSSCCEVWVNVPVKSITINTTSLLMRVGEQEDLDAEICPTDAVNQLIRWTSTDTSVVWVNEATGRVEARGEGNATVYATAQDGTGVKGSCAIQVEPPITVQCIDLCCDKYTMNVGETTYLSYDLYPADATNQDVTWCSSNPSVAIVNASTGKITAISAGTTTITVTTDDGSYVDSCSLTIISRYQYELIASCGFSKNVSELIISVYERINNIYSSQTNTERAWRTARLLSEFCYDYLTTLAGISINRWDNVAGSVTTEESRKTYFLDTLGYTESEYDTLNDGLLRNKEDADRYHNIIDFTHMQYALAARLAYTLHKDGKLSNWGSGLYTGNFGRYTNEEVSYLGGWLGDAILTNLYGVGTTIMKNEDYMADLDAENVYRIILQGYSSVEAFSNYYSSISNSNNRAHIFTNHISFETVRNKVFYELIDAELYMLMSNASQNGEILMVNYYLNLINDEQYHYNTIQATYPDTYDFLISLNNHRSTLKHYQ